MVLEAWSMCRPSKSSGGAIPLEVYYTGSDMHWHFPYSGFEWLPLLSPLWIHGVVGVLAFAGVTMALGLFHRVSATLVFLTWGYFYAVESTRTYWMSYYYLELLVTFLLIWMPASRRFSVDAWWRRGRSVELTVPRWTVLLLQVQLAITYFYAGVAKLSADWLVDAQPVRYFLSQPHVAERCEQWLPAAWREMAQSAFQGAGIAYFISWAGAAFDLAAGALLMTPRTRFIGMVVLIAFHCMNHFVIFDDIVWFPLLGVLTSSIFWRPDWPERLWQWLKRLLSAETHNTSPRDRPKVPGAAGSELVRAPATKSIDRNLAGPQTGRYAAPFVAFWCLTQMLIPLRHHFIAGDSRFTFEGLSFSWRLKADVYRAAPCEIWIDDGKVLSRDAQGRRRLNWSEWHGGRTVFHQLDPGRIDWATLPEIIVLSEPMTGERIIYNPLGGPEPVLTEARARLRVAELWYQCHGRKPAQVRMTVPLPGILDAYATAWQTKGGTPFRNRGEALASIRQLQRHEGSAWITFVLRRMPPFALQGGTMPDAPFLLVEDPVLFGREGTKDAWRIAPSEWKNGPGTRLEGEHGFIYETGDPMVIHTVAVDVDLAALLPRISILIPASPSPVSTGIRWDYLEDLSHSKAMHISVQPFLLRRYARRAADWWEKEFGRRPAVRASTAVSVNFRPHEPQVDPTADLASVPVRWFVHDPWIRDLQTKRIPPEGVATRAVGPQNSPAGSEPENAR